jgi:hypothetical protein
MDNCINFVMGDCNEAVKLSCQKLMQDPLYKALTGSNPVQDLDIIREFNASKISASKER